MDIAPPLRPEPIRPGLALPDGGTETLAHARIRPETVGLAMLLGGTAVLYLWNLAASGWANAYYSAAALAGSQDWTAWFFGSFDAGNALTVDKTPAAMWVMGLSVRLFGLSPWSVLVPQAIMGVAAVAILYATVRRAVGPLGAFVGAAAFALTPVAALMFRFNNPDALLVLLLVVAAYCTIRGIEVGATRWLVAAGIAVGFAFLAKMLQAYLVIPALAAVVLIASPVSLPRRIGQVAAAAVAVIVTSGWYLAVVQLWPANSRPYIGGSQTNSIIELLLGYNGFRRLTGNEVGRDGGGGPFEQGAGLLRLFSGEAATEIAWLLPTALALGLALLWIRRQRPPHRPRPIPGDPVARLAASHRSGVQPDGGDLPRVLHGRTRARDRRPRRARRRSRLAGPGHVSGVALSSLIALGSAAWIAYLLQSTVPTWLPLLAPILLGGAALVAIALVSAHVNRDVSLQRIAFAGAIGVVLLTPTIASIATAAEPHTGSIPTAVPTAQASGGGPGGAGFRGQPRAGGFGGGGRVGGGGLAVAGSVRGGGFGGGGPDSADPVAASVGCSTPARQAAPSSLPSVTMRAVIAGPPRRRARTTRPGWPCRARHRCSRSVASTGPILHRPWPSSSPMSARA